MTGKKLVIPEEMFPSVGIEEIEGSDGRTYLVRNDAMFTAYKHSQGEFSEFFKAIRDECRILGNRCPSCHQIICPPFEQRCPQCNFVEMKPEEMTDVGVMVASPVISFFAPARFKNQVPYGEGDVFLEDKKGKEAATALPVRVRTTQGMIRPGIFKKGTKVKVVFCDSRLGEAIDIFVVPQSELTPAQIVKNPLMESDLSWDEPTEPVFEEPTEEMVQALEQVFRGFDQLSARVRKSPRAQKDLANWVRRVRVKTRAGTFYFFINNGQLGLLGGEPDFTLAIENPADLLPYLEKGAALTNLVMEGTLWVSKSELETIFRLDRLPRSLRRDNC